MNLTFEQFWTMMDRAERQAWNRIGELLFEVFWSDRIYEPLRRLAPAKDQPDSPRNRSGSPAGSQLEECQPTRLEEV